MNPPHPPPDNPLAPAPPATDRDQFGAQTGRGGSLRDRIAHENPHLVPMKKCQELAMMEGYKYLGGAAVGTFVVAKLAKVSPNAAVASAAGAGVLVGFFAAALNFQLCSTTLGRDLHAAVYSTTVDSAGPAESRFAVDRNASQAPPGSLSVPLAVAVEERRN
ncbi:hypothetical protein BCR44DRAFT_26194 [Catenaria anguillulae PL171]|uniref:Uncharacterized protein n=1 Tax=Catenaria anguillulae PL171 TaxID=765915 RepID=A0A1Y2HMK2_9FUNG|nr:hypothetical protein BCR44DRAFT_26194 [Catenaria anguillulae PL171]